METSTAVRVPIGTQYYQFDQQGVVFNMWYLAFMEEARNAYLEARGYPLRQLLDDGYDIQVVHTEIDWSRAVRYGDAIEVEVACGHVGRTSVRLNFSVIVDGSVAATASSVYVIVDGAISGKASIPEGLRSALTR